MTRPLIIYVGLILTNILILTFTSSVIIFFNIIMLFGLLIIGIISLLEKNEIESGILIKYFKVKKKVYYKSFKNIFIVYKDDNIYLMQDKFFRLKFIKRFYADSNLDKIKGNIESGLNDYFSKPVSDAETIIRNWNGFLNKQDERDKKLEDIL